MKNKLIVVGIAISVIALSYVCYMFYERHSFVASITPHVKNTSLRLVNATRYEIEDGTKITYKELFEKLESDISEIDKHILDVQTIATPSNKNISEPILMYLKSSQTLLRSILSKYRKQLDFNAANEVDDRNLEDLKNANYYGHEYALKTATRGRAELIKAKNEYVESISDVLNAITKMKEANTNAAAIISSDALIEASTLEKLANINNEIFKVLAK